MDAVMAAAAVPADARMPMRILDAGAGVGVLGLCLARRVPTAHVTLVEIDAALASLAEQNAARNQLGDRVRVIVQDICAGGAAFDPVNGHPELQASSFDHVVSNPPYHVEGRGSASPNMTKARAHAMPEVELDAWIRFLTGAAKTGGTVTIIHRVEALPELLSTLSPRFGGLKLLPLHSRAGEAARRVIVQGIKGSRAPLALLPGLVLHADTDGFSPTIDAILRSGAPLTI